MEILKHVETKEIIEYKGNCPKCNKEQIEQRSVWVDTLCNNCLRTEQLKQLKEKYKYLLNSKIIDIDGVDTITRIKIETTDSKIFNVYADKGDYDSDAFFDIEYAIDQSKVFNKSVQ